MAPVSPERGRFRLQEAKTNKEVANPIQGRNVRILRDLGSAEGAQIRWQPLVAVAACHLFDQIDFALDIRTPRGHLKVERPIARSARCKADGREALPDRVPIELNPKHVIHPSRSKADQGAAGRPRIDVDRLPVQPATRHGQYKLDQPLDRVGQTLRIDAALEPIRGVGVKLQLTRATANTLGIEMSAL